MLTRYNIAITGFEKVDNFFCLTVDAGRVPGVARLALYNLSFIYFTCFSRSNNYAFNQ